MGEVYRARDTRLGRDVAVKVLPSAVAQDTDRLARFDREARTLAALNHPAIAQIYGVEHLPADAGAHGSVEPGHHVPALVMELVEGPTLADRIAQGAIPLDEALAIAKQVAEALEAAHEHGIVHRDLKPANIKLRPDGAVKVLDFGLAKAFGPDQAPLPDLSQAPTVTSPPAPFYWHSGAMAGQDVTQAGMILGTAAYMAPEQASGKPVDKRADIWSFGVVLWEMLAGRRLFEGETVSHVLAAVLTSEPDMMAAPARVRALLSRCLEKDARRRLRDIGDAMSLVQEAQAGAPVAARNARIGSRGWAAAAAVMAVVAVAAWLRPTTIADAASPVVRFSIERSSDIYSNSALSFAVSPDGRFLAHFGPAAGGQQAVFVRTLATGEVREIPGSTTATIRASSLFWSSDGRQLVHGATNSTSVIDVMTGITRPLCDCRFSGGSWNADDVILLGSAPVTPGGIRRLAANDRTQVVVTQPDASKLEQDQWPVFLPDGRRFLFTRLGADGAVATWLGTLDGGTSRRVADGSQRIFVPASAGHSAYLLGIDEAGLVAQPFDENTLSITGQPQVLIPGAAAVSASSNGVLATSRAGKRPPFVPAWFDRNGKALGQVGDAGSIQSIALSPDGRKLAMDQFRDGPGVQSSDIWLRDLTGGSNTRLTFNPDSDSTPVWAPDGSRIVFSALHNGVQHLEQRRVDGTGNETPFVEFGTSAWINDWSSDGRWAIFSSVRPDDAFNDLWVVPIENGVARTPASYVGGPARQQQAQFSPDGRFVAYGSDQTGTFEIYVQPFPDAGDGKWMISNGGGSEPRWSRDGRELYYFSGQTLMAVPVHLQPTFSNGPAVALFDAPVLSNYTNDGHRWQVAPDGKRFLLLTSTGKDEAPPLDVAVNWPALLPR